MKKTRKFVSIFAILFALVFALSVCFFAACGKKDDESQDETPVSHEHNYVVDGTTWTFSEDYSECTATANCTATEGTCDAPTKTVNADVTPNPVSATCTEAGTVTYVATYEGKTVKTSDAVVTDAALGHDVTATWNESTSGWDYTCSRNDTISEGDTFASTKYMAGSKDALASAFENGGTVELTADIVGTFTVSASVVLDLHGHTLQNVEDNTATYEADTDTDDNDETEVVNDTVTVTSEGSLTILDGTCGEGETVAEGSIKNIYSTTLNGNTTSGYSSDSAAVIFTEGAVVMESGLIDGASVGIRAQSGTVTMNGGKISTDFYAIWEDVGVVTVTVNDGEIEGVRKGIYVGGDGNFGLSGYQTGAMTTLIINGGSITCEKDSAICTLGYTSVDSAYIEINGGTLASEYVDDTTKGDGDSSTRIPAIYLPGGTLKITDGEISGATALEVRGGKATISGGTFETTAQETNTPAYQGSGATSYGYSVAVYPFGEKNSRYTSDPTFDVSTDVTISGGTFEGPIYKSSGEEEYTSTETGAPTYTFTITGGTFSEDIESEYLDVENYHTELQKDGTYKVAAGVAGRNVEGMITADAYVASQTDMGDGTTLDSEKKELMSENGTSVSFYGDTGESPSAKISRKNRTSTDGYLFTFAIQLKKATVESGSLSNCIEVTVTNACTVTVYVLGSGSDTRTLGTWTKSDSTYTQDGTTYSVGADANENFVPIEISFASAGTYIIGSTSGNINFYGLMFGTVAA